ncbi:tRNA(Ile)-lysidine synthase [Sporosarcina sp. NCCP-2716]|uniref:tRNA lysidine(34) synthetase TilS n=1 Tax=Sporosarcina sp. NCCP-2716 TaxID=2943679 RepID=UPI00203AF468|nr:tRNA lysidine(34) synthetase TilS [Sporosarcina sp. NCCP-2716]GKV70369.1 tRNA(Ile)-lysidine synthase [Sporosarcina sp. NCCP-2716]
MDHKWTREVLGFIRRKGLLQRGDRVLAACSGGVDSMVMLHYLAAARQRIGIEVGAVHVDHCLRGEESAADGEAVQLLADRFGIPCFRTIVPVPELLEQSGGSVQDVCRTGRYGKFEEVMTAGGYTVLAVAHHAEDQLETVLMQLAKGQRPKGMPISRSIGQGRLIRPLLQLGKADLYRYASEHGVAYREDPSNEKDDYTRNRYRHHVLPALLAEEPAAAGSAVRVSETLQEEEDYLSRMAAEHAAPLIAAADREGVLSVRSEAFRAMHPALQKRVVPLLLKYLYNGETLHAIYNVSLLEQLIRQLCEVHGSASVDLPEGWRLQREYGVSSFVREEEGRRPCRSIPFPEDEWVRWGTCRLRWCRAERTDADELVGLAEWRYFLPAEDGMPSEIRTRKPGDRIRLPGMDSPKKLSRLFIDGKVDPSKRDTLPVIISEQGRIYAIPGVRYGDCFSQECPAGEAYILMMDRTHG